jgi:hypothetical protein
VAETSTAGARERSDDDELRLGDLVVIMVEPGPFLIVEIDPPWVTIQSQQGVRRKVSQTAVRKVGTEPPVAR